MRTATALILTGWALGAQVAGAEDPDPLAAAIEHHLAGRWQEALAAYRDAAAGSDPAVAAVAHNNSCLIHNNLGDYPAALTACREALRLRRGQGDDQPLAKALNNLGLTLQHLGRYDEAALTYREALSINERRGDLEAQLINRQNLGLVAQLAGRYGEALERFTAAEALAERHAGEPWAPRQRRLARLHQGVVLERLGAWDQALELYREVAAEKDDMEPAHWASVVVNLGVVYRNLGDPVKAVAAFEEAAAAYERLGDAAALSNVTLNLALAWHLNLGRLDDAEGAYRKALELARSTGDRSEEIQDLFFLGRLLVDRRRLDEAEGLFRQCLDVARDAGSSEGSWSALSGLGQVEAARGNLPEASEHLEQAMDEIEQVRAGLAEGELRSDYFGDKRPVYAAAVGVLAALDAAEPGAGHQELALDVVQRTKSRELLDSLSGDRGRAAPLASGEITALAAGSVVLEYFLGRDDLFLLRIDSDGVHLENLGPAAPIAGVVLEVHRALAAGRRPSAGELEGLSRTLLHGLEEEIDGAEKLWVAPDGALHYLPFEILPGPGGGLLVDRVEVAYLPSASALGWLGSPPKPAERALVGFGDPELRGSAGDRRAPSDRWTSRFDLGPLPAAARELSAIRELLGGEGEIATGGRATEEALRRAAARGARVIHLATHTVVDERPQQGAAILLTPDAGDDGLLRPAEIAALDYRADLTVLAACRSALGAVEDGRAFASLTGSFLTAGSSAVVASLWDVGDEASAVFMEQLYYQLSRGHPPAAALRRAKLRLRSDPAWDRTDLWAAYVLVGDAPAVVPARWLPTWAWVAVGLVVAVGLWRILRRDRR